MLLHFLRPNDLQKIRKHPMAVNGFSKIFWRIGNEVIYRRIQGPDCGLFLTAASDVDSLIY